MSATRPPLPAKAMDPSRPVYFTADQMRTYGEACAAAEREACAALLDVIAADYEKAHSFFERNAADYCAGAIRARKDTE